MRSRAYITILLAGLAALSAPRDAAAVTTTVDGSAAAFYNRNFGSYLGAVAPVQGESVGATLASGILSDRLLRYSLGGGLVEGRSIGLAHRVHILDGNTFASLRLFPIKWYQIGAGFASGRLRLQDGPQYSWSSWSRSWYTDLSLRPPRAKLPGLYSRYGDFRYRTSLASVRGEQRRTGTLRLDENFTPDTRADATYDLTNIDYLASTSTYRTHRVSVNLFSRPSTTTILTVRSSADWYDTTGDAGAQNWAKILGYQALWTENITLDDQLNVSAGTMSQKSYRSYLLTNDAQALWYHRFIPEVRGKAGGEFGHQATDGTTVGFEYQKFREAGLLGGDARLPFGSFELQPVYTLTAGSVQVERGGGGSLIRHEAALPLLYAGLDATPMVLTGYLALDRDTSSVPVWRRYRAVNYRIDVFSYTEGGSGSTSRIFLEAQRSRTEDTIMTVRSQIDDTHAGIQASTTINRLYSSFALGYTMSWIETLLIKYNVRQAGANWTWWPAAGLQIGNSVNVSKTSFSNGDDLTRIYYQADGAYRWRALEFTSSFRYDTFEVSNEARWGMFFQVRRYFSYGG